MSQINEKFVITGCLWKALFFRSITTVINLFDTLSAPYNGVANDGNFFNLTLNMCPKLSFLNVYNLNIIYTNELACLLSKPLVLYCNYYACMFLRFLYSCKVFGDKICTFRKKIFRIINLTFNLGLLRIQGG